MIIQYVYLLVVFKLFYNTNADYMDKENKALTLVSEILDEDGESTDGVFSISDESFITNTDEFIANENWQEVKEGQAIPAGLHIRLNLETGLREAKLLSPQDQKNSKNELQKQAKLDVMKSAMEEAVQELNSKDINTSDLEYWKDGDKEGMRKIEGQSFSKEELKVALKKFKLNRDDVRQGTEEDGNDDSFNKVTNIEGRFRTMDELKSEFKNLEFGIKSDLDILRSYYSLYNRSTNNNEKIELLDQLIDLMHQIDNANNFVDMGGVKLLIKDLNSTDVFLKSLVLPVLSVAAQNNPHAQVACMKEGLLHILFQLVADKKEPTTRRRALTCLSCLLRGFPYAQRRFMEFGGLDLLVEILRNYEQGNNDLTEKVVTLLCDLVDEQVSIQSDSEISEKLKFIKKKKVPTATLR